MPAHNEASVILKTISNFSSIVSKPGYELIVSCNGCQDDTASLVMEHYPKATVIEIPEASKIAALNAAEAIANSKNRIFIDADISIRAEAIQKIANVLLTSQYPVAVAPRLSVNVKKASLGVRLYYRIWTALPYVRNGLIGAGVYALNASGRKRFDKFPNIVADDEYVRLHFSPSERKTISDEYFEIVAPVNLTELIRVKTRVWVGNYELSKKFPDLVQAGKKSYKSFFLSLIFRPDLWVCTPVYVLSQIKIRRQARKRIKQGNFYWERDFSSR